MLHIPKIELKDYSQESISAELKNISPEQIGANNWSAAYPYAPEVSFKVAHDGKNIFLQYQVCEKEILAQAQGNNSEVWKDSCVEFFVSFDDGEHYYNIEQSCIGQILIGWRKSKTKAIHATDEIIDSIIRYPSLGSENFELKIGSFRWSLLTVISVKTFWKDNFNTLDGIKATANFYKCGDNLKTPHFSSWSPIRTDTPSFHQPDFFEKVSFDS